MAQIVGMGRFVGANRWQGEARFLCCQELSTPSLELFSSNRPTGPIRSSSRHVHVSIYLSICPLFMRFFSRPLIGPQVT